MFLSSRDFWILTHDYRPLVADDIAEAAIYMLNQPLNVSIKALDVVPSGWYLFWFIEDKLLTDTAQRSLNVFDRNWNERNRQ